MLGQEGYFGTNAFQTLLDIDKIVQSGITAEEDWNEDKDDETIIQNAFDELTNQKEDGCSLANLTIRSNVSNIASVDLGEDNNYNPEFLPLKEIVMNQEPIDFFYSL